MDVCYRNQNARKIAKRYKGNNAKELLEMLKKRFQVIQDNVKQSETTIFNTMSIKTDESTGAFVDRLIEQADKLEDMGEAVSEVRKMTRLKEGLYVKYPHLSHSLAMQVDLNWDRMENLVRSYEHTIFANCTSELGKTDETAAANFAFNKKFAMSGNGAKKMCRVCKKPGHLASECKRAKKIGGLRGKPKGSSDFAGKSKFGSGDKRKCYVCDKVGHIARDCRMRTRGDNEDSEGGRKRKVSAVIGNAGRPSWFGGPSKNHRNLEVDDDSDMGAMFVELEKDFSEVDEQLESMYDDEAVINYALSENLFEKDERIILDSGCNRVAVNKRELFNELDLT